MFPTALSSASSAIQHHLQQFESAARQISDPNAVAGIDEIVKLKQAKHGVEINAAVIKTANQMSDHLIDILA